jgi:hypothetical protein
MTLTEFLLARIAEDEAAARAVGWTPRWVMAHDLPDAPPGIVAHIARHDPARVLAECAAKRRIVELADDATGLDMQVDSEFAAESRNEVTSPYLGDVILRALAMPYADHADYPLTHETAPTQP